jgi:hypothetical protein
VFRNEDTSDVSLLIVANDAVNPLPSLEFNLKQPKGGWSNNLLMDLNNQSVSYIKYTNASGKVYSTINLPPDLDPFKIQFSKFEFVQDGIVNATMNGMLNYDADTTTVTITGGVIKLKVQN